MLIFYCPSGVVVHIPWLIPAFDADYHPVSFLHLHLASSVLLPAIRDADIEEVRSI